jgi:hypothetical protein
MHGRHRKDVAVLHETVSGDIPGWKDIDNTESYLANKGYGIHGMTDSEGHKAWAYGLGTGVFYHCGGVNDRSIGIEQVSNVMLNSPSNKIRRKIWVARNKQLRATAQLISAIAHAQNWPEEWLRYSDGDHPGITSHWSVSQNHSSSEGHTDCWPVHLGGYYPALSVVSMSRRYYKLGYRFQANV